MNGAALVSAVVLTTEPGWWPETVTWPGDIKAALERRVEKAQFLTIMGCRYNCAFSASYRKKEMEIRLSFISLSSTKHRQARV